MNFDLHPLYILYSFLVTALIMGLPFVIYYKRQKAKEKYAKPEYDDVEDPEALARAEESVKDMDLLQSLHDKYIHLQSFQTINGHDRTTMTELVLYLKDKGIESDFYFSQAYPAGFASLTSGMGEYFLFVDPNKQEEALRALDSYYNPKNH